MVTKPTLLSSIAPSSRVLIVDRSDENREVLRVMLRRHGYETYEAERDTDGLELAKSCRPNVLVLDLDTVDPADAQVCEAFDNQAKSENASVVLLGRIPSTPTSLSASNVVAKPYHYRPLLRKIEELLRRSDATN